MKLFFCGLVVVMLVHDQAAAFSTDTLRRHCKSYSDNDFQASHPDHNICISYVLGVLDTMNFNCIYSRLLSVDKEALAHLGSEATSKDLPFVIKQFLDKAGSNAHLSDKTAFLLLQEAAKAVEPCRQ